MVSMETMELVSMVFWEKKLFPWFFVSMVFWRPKAARKFLGFGSMVSGGRRPPAKNFRIWFHGFLAAEGRQKIFRDCYEGFLAAEGRQ